MSLETAIGYAIGVIFNIAAVAGMRIKAADWGAKWLQSGRAAGVTVFVLCFLQLLVVGHFDAFRNSDAFIALINKAATMAAAVTATFAIAKATPAKNVLK